MTARIFKSLHPTKEQRFAHPDNTDLRDIARSYYHLLSLCYTTESVVKDLRRLRAELRKERAR